MARSVLMGYATRYGSTREVAEAVAARLGEGGLAVDVQPLRAVRGLDGYDAVVMGAALYMYRWHKDARRFLSRHRQGLMTRPVAVFALGPVHEPHDSEEWQNSRAQLDKDLAKFPWFEPEMLALFGGKYDPEALGFPIRLFAGAEPASDIRDWAAIRDWADELASRFRAELS